jgi:hypothetical protein
VGVSIRSRVKTFHHLLYLPSSILPSSLLQMSVNRNRISNKHDPISLYSENGNAFHFCSAVHCYPYTIHKHTPKPVHCKPHLVWPSPHASKQPCHPSPPWESKYTQPIIFEKIYGYNLHQITGTRHTYNPQACQFDVNATESGKAKAITISFWKLRSEMNCIIIRFYDRLIKNLRNYDCRSGKGKVTSH